MEARSELQTSLQQLMILARSSSRSVEEESSCPTWQSRSSTLVFEDPSDTVSSLN
jgi:hypothetical protein